jgi:transposase-like protein
MEVIGPAVQEMASGRGTGSVARAVGVAQSTVRSWCQRHRERSRVAHAVAVMVAVVIGLGLAELASPVEVSVLASLEVLARAAGEKESLGRWPAVSLVTGGMWLIPVSSARSTTSRVYPNSAERRLMALIDPNDETRPP